MNPVMETYETLTPSEAKARIWDIWQCASTKYTRNSAQLQIYRALFCDIANDFPNFAPHDYQYLSTRIEKEGYSFFLETLPKLGKAFETSLITSQDFIIPDGWKLMHGTRLPKFLYALFSQVIGDNGAPLYDFCDFERSSGRLKIDREKLPVLDEFKAVRAVRYLRQCLMAWSKVEVFTDVDENDTDRFQDFAQTAKNRKAIEDFAERMSGIWDLENKSEIHDYLVEARRLLRCVFTTQCPELDELIAYIKRPWGRQGPGAVAGREVGAEKWSFNQWPGLPTSLFNWNGCNGITTQKLPTQPYARLCLVPKDFRGPRVICIEPKENQFAQQGLMDILYRLVQRCALTRRSINFLDTERSRSACYDYRYATIDLKDASDTINLVLARTLLPRWVFKLVTRYRSRGIITPTGVVKSRCLATMGNATCFPLETLIFWALSLGTMIVLRDSLPERQSRYLNLDMRVFGDDIIVPLWACDGVARTLELAGMVVNTQKTCCFSPVRESCGEWVFMNHCVRIARFKTLDVTDYRSFIQWLDLMKDLEQDGTNESMPALYEGLRDRVVAYIESVQKTYPRFWARRYNKRLQRLERLCPTFVQVGRIRELDGYAGLYAWQVHNDRTPFLRGVRKRTILRWRAEDSTTRLVEG